MKIVKSWVLQIFIVSVITALTVSCLKAVFSDIYGVKIPNITPAVTAAVTAAFVVSNRKKHPSNSKV